jgi:hypothetical protein
MPTRRKRDPLRIAASQLTGRRLKLQVNIADRHVAMLDRLAVAIRLRHGVVISRAHIIGALVEAAERGGWAAELFKV